MVRVLPVPAPARMQTGPVTAWAAVRCSSSSAASTASAREAGSVPGRSDCDIGPPSVLAADVCTPILSAGRDDAGKHPQGCGVARETRHGDPPLGWTRSDLPGRIPSMTSTPTAPVTMYTTDWCGYCVRLKKLMQREGIPFAEVNIEHDAQAAELVMQANGGNRTVPTLLFADGVALTNPSIDQVKSQLSAAAEA